MIVYVKHFKINSNETQLQLNSSE